MNVIVVFWVNAENFVAVIKRDESYTVDEQVELYEKESCYSSGTLYGNEIELIEQD